MTGRARIGLLVGFLLLPAVAHAQGEAYLRQFFHKKTVIARIDMPATADGVDLYPGRVPSIDSPVYGERLGRYGIAIRLGEAVVVSNVDVRKDRIEFHLGGGGYRMKISAGLGASLAGVKVQKTKAEQAVEALSRGSRFNLRYVGKVPADAQTPQAVVQALANYLQFPEEDFGPEVATWVEEAKPARPPATAGTGEEAVRQFFEGRMVMVKMDMPGGSDGVVIYPERSPEIDSVRYAKEVRKDGAGVGIGEVIMVTRVKAKADAIEFQLGGGGYGTFWQTVRNMEQMPAPAGSSPREDELKRQIAQTSDPNERRRLQDELDDARADRERQRELDQAQYTERSARNAEAEKKLTLRAGSRFNIRFEKPVPPEALTPQGLMRLLSEFLYFPEDEFGSSQ